MKRLNNQDEASRSLIKRGAERRANAVEWIRRAVQAHDAGDYALAERLHAQSKLEWPFPGTQPAT